MKVEDKEHKLEKVAKSQVGNIVHVTGDWLSTLAQNYGKLFTDVYLFYCFTDAHGVKKMMGYKEDKTV